MDLVLPESRHAKVVHLSTMATIAMKTWLIHGSLAAAALVSFFGCGNADEEERSYTDTTGAVFVRRCEGGSCGLQPQDAVCGDGAAMMGARWLLACSTHGKAGWNDNCRPVVCSSSSECHYFRGGSTYECLNGLCEDPDWGDEWTKSDVIAYCLRDLPRSEHCTAGFEDSFPMPQAEWISRDCDSDGLNMNCSKLPEECQ
jgi:hypothetical protein